MRDLVLASGSPRRKELLERAGLLFTIDPSTFDEGSIDPYSLAPHSLAMFLSQKKAEEVFSRHGGSVVLAADTFIFLDGEIMGKPHTPDEARRMLRLLSGRSHSVITGFTIISRDRAFSGSAESRVTFRALSEDDIEDYIRTGEPLDKAGAYAIQGIGSSLVESLEGSMDNVVGLPVKEVLEALAGFGIRPA